VNKRLVIAILFWLWGGAQATELSYINATLFTDPIKQVQVQGNYAYGLSDMGLQIFFVSDPAAPTLVGGYPYAYARGKLAVGDSCLYVASSDSAIRIFDIADPAYPIFEGAWGSYSSIYDIEIQGNYAYVLADSGLYTLDISNPHLPVGIGYCPIPQATGDLFVRGNYAFVALQPNGFRIVNIANPALPQVLGSGGTILTPVRLCADSTYLYILDWDGREYDGNLGLEIFSITNPTHPVILGTYSEAGKAGGFCVRGNYAYIANQYFMLSVVDMTNHTNPQRVGGLSLDQPLYDLSLENGVLYGAGPGFFAIDIDNPVSPSLIGSYEMNFDVCGVYMSGNYAYVVSNSGLYNIGFEDPRHLRTVGKMPFMFLGNPKIDGQGGLIALSAGMSGSYVVDVSYPDFPILVRQFPSLHRNDAVCIASDYVYMADGPVNGVRIFTINDQDFERRVMPPSNTWGLYIRDSLLYISQAGNFSVANVADRENPFITSSQNLSGVGWDVLVSGIYAYIAQGDARVSVWDISNPAYPNWLTNCNTRGEAKDLALSGNHLFVAEAESGVEVIDISDPYDPSITVIYKTFVRAKGIAAVGDDVIVADNNCLLLLKYLHPDAIDETPSRPDIFSLSQNYPNPFNAQTTISYNLTYAAEVTLYIYDILGRKVAALETGLQSAGKHELIWDAKDAASGVYFYIIEGQSQTAQKMVLLK
jgi:hypothetical protein